MSRNMVLLRIAASALAMGMVAAFATAGHAQEEDTLSCRYIAAEFDPLGVLAPVSAEFQVPLSATQTNNAQTRRTRASGLATVLFEESDNGVPGAVQILEGSFVAEVDATFSAPADDETLSCVNTARVLGVGELSVVDEEAEEALWLIRSNSRLNGRQREETLGECAEAGLEGDACSVHRVNASLRITAQGVRNNLSLEYDRFNVNREDIFEIYVGEPPLEGSQGVVLVCSCLAEVEPPEEPEEPEEPAEE